MISASSPISEFMHLAHCANVVHLIIGTWKSAPSLLFPPVTFKPRHMRRMRSNLRNLRSWFERAPSASIQICAARRFFSRSETLSCLYCCDAAGLSGGLTGGSCPCVGSRGFGGCGVTTVKLPSEALNQTFNAVGVEVQPAADLLVSHSVVAMACRPRGHQVGVCADHTPSLSAKLGEFMKCFRGSRHQKQTSWQIIGSSMVPYQHPSNMQRSRWLSLISCWMMAKMSSFVIASPKSGNLASTRSRQTLKRRTGTWGASPLACHIIIPTGSKAVGSVKPASSSPHPTSDYAVACPLAQTGSVAVSASLRAEVAGPACGRSQQARAKSHSRRADCPGVPSCRST